MALTAEQRATYTQRLSAAESAYHDLMCGASIRTVVDQNGERIEYAPSSAPKLAQYIAELKRLLGQTTAGPMNVWL